MDVAGQKAPKRNFQANFTKFTKGTKKKFSGKPDKVYKNKCKNHTNFEESNKKSKMVDSDSDHIVSDCDLFRGNNLNPTARQRSTRASWWLEAVTIQYSEAPLVRRTIGPTHH